MLRKSDAFIDEAPMHDGNGCPTSIWHIVWLSAKLIEIDKDRRRSGARRTKEVENEKVHFHVPSRDPIQFRNRAELGMCPHRIAFSGIISENGFCVNAIVELSVQPHPKNVSLVRPCDQVYLYHYVSLALSHR